MFLNKLFDLLLLQVFKTFWLEMENELASSFKLFSSSVFFNTERTSSSGLPDVLVIMERLRDNSDSICSKESRVESHSELTNHGDICTSFESLHKSFGSRFGNGSQVGDKLLLGHSNTCINNDQSFVSFIWNYLNFELRLDIQTSFFWFSDRLVSDLIQSIRGV